MITNRFHYRMNEPNSRAGSGSMSETSSRGGSGVGQLLLETAAADPVDVELALHLIEGRRQAHGEGVVAVDGGANVGTHTVEWAIAMTGWGSVIAIEAQERIYYALAGNIALNNCFNAIAMHAAISSEPGIMQIPTPDYLVPSNVSNLELRPRADTEFIGQPVDYSAAGTVAIQKISIDAMALPRVDFHQARPPGHGARDPRRRATDDRALSPDFPARIAQGRPRAFARLPRRARLQGGRGRLQSPRRAQERPGRPATAVAGHAGAIGSPTASPLHSLAAVVATASSRIGA
jgi:FkbM family methyltransferase